VLWPGAEDAFRSLYGIGQDKLGVIPNARSSEEFHPATDIQRTNARLSLGLRGDSTVIGCVGSISEEKRLNLAVNAVARVPDVQLLIVGDGPLRADLEQHARDVLGERVTFTGVLDDVTTAYDAIDVLLVPSRTEGMPGVVLEASMSAIPMIAAEVGAIPWLFDEGVPGTLISVSAPASVWSESLRELVGVDERPKPVSPRGCAWHEVTERWAEIISDLCAPFPLTAASDARRLSDA
jgi:glycosyltransferase involved in cell wall biosynthesis